MLNGIDLLIIVIGLLLTGILFNRFRSLPEHTARDGASYPRSVRHRASAK